MAMFCSVCLGRQTELTLSKGLIRGTSQLRSKYKCKMWATKSVAQQHISTTRRKRDSPSQAIGYFRFIKINI